MFLNFDNIDVAVNGSGILSSSAQINSNNELQPAYVIGFINPVTQYPHGPIKSNFTFNYVPEIDQEPNFSVLNNIKNILNDCSYSGEKIEVAGLTSNNCFLQQFTIQIKPNNTIENSVNYDTFWPLCGNLNSKTNLINYLNDGSIAHSWTTYILNSGDYLSTPVYELTYEFKVNWHPVYLVGKKYPVEVKLLGVEESITFSMDNYRNILITGEDVYGNIFQDNNGNIQLNNLSLLCKNKCSNSNYLSLNISGFKIKSNNLVARNSEYVRVNYTASKYY